MSSEHNVGRILLLVGAITALFSGLLIVGIFVLMLLAVGPLPGGGPSEYFPRGFLSPFWFIGVMGVLSVAGAVVAFIGWSVAARDPHKAGILGIVATLLPPTNLIALAGGVMLLISPEAKAQAALRDGADARPPPPGPH